jgi:hypothetical protein
LCQDRRYGDVLIAACSSSAHRFSTRFVGAWADCLRLLVLVLAASGDRILVLRHGYEVVAHLRGVERCCEPERSRHRTTSLGRVQTLQPGMDPCPSAGASASHIDLDPIPITKTGGVRNDHEA